MGARRRRGRRRTLVGLDLARRARGDPGLRPRRLVGREDRPGLGARVVAVSDVHGAMRSDAGLDAEALAAYVAAGGKVGEYRAEGVEHVDPGGAARDALRGPDPSGAGRDGPCRQRRPARLPGRGRGRQQPHDANRRRYRRRQGDHGHPRRAGQRRRRGVLVLRVGPEPAALPLGRARSQREARSDHAPRLRRVRGGGRTRRRHARVASYELWIERVPEAARTRAYV